jgi:hypothetical protein
LGILHLENWILLVKNWNIQWMIINNFVTSSFRL